MTPESMTELVELVALAVVVVLAHGGMPLHLWKTHATLSL